MQAYFSAPASTWMHSPRPAVTLTFDFQNLIRSSIAACEYSLMLRVCNVWQFRHYLFFSFLFHCIYSFLVCCQLTWWIKLTNNVSYNCRRHCSSRSWDIVGCVAQWLERWSLTDELSLSHAGPAAAGWPPMWVRRPLQVSQLGQLSLLSFRGR